MHDQQEQDYINYGVSTPPPPTTTTITTTTTTTQQSFAINTTPRNSLGSGAALSYSSSSGGGGGGGGTGSSISPSTSSSSGIQSASKIAVSECLGAWLNYLQTLNNLCASGHRLAQTIAAFEQIAMEPVATIPAMTTSSTPPSTTTTQSSTVHQQQQQQQPHHQASVTPPPIAPFQLNPNIQLITAWDDLAKSTAVATSTVKSHIVAVLQDFTMQCVNNTTESSSDAERSRDIKQQIVMETTQTMINIQHQFCGASYDSFSMFMCCFVCQAPMGYPHDSDCAMLQQSSFPRSQNPSMTGLDPRSQTPSPHFGSIAMNYLPARNEREMRPLPQQTQPHGTLFGSGSTQGSGYVEHNYNNNNNNIVGLTNTGGISLMESSSICGGRGASPHHEIRGPSPIQGFLDNVRGPLPNPGHLLGMKAPFYRGSRSPLNFPLFPLSGQRRWSEAAAGEVKNESLLDYESQMRRWSMPWEASKSSDKNTVSWHQTRIMPISKLAVPGGVSSSKSSAAATTSTYNERSQSTTPDSIWQPTLITSQDGLAEAIQLLSCRPNRILSQPQQASMLGPPFIEEPQSSTHVAGGIYEMWSNRTQDRLPFIKFPRDLEKEKSIDENG